jgi:hypothetical protein
MTMRLQAQQEAGDAPDVSRRAEPAAPSSTAAVPGQRQVSFDQFSVMFPDLVSRAVVNDG